MNRRIVMVALVTAIAACSPAASEPSSTRDSVIDSTTASSTTVPPTTTTTAQECPTRPLTDVRVNESDPTAVSLQLSAIAFPDCADVVVVALATDDAVLTASALAIEAGAPLLVAGDDVSGIRREIERLRPRRVVTVGMQMERFPETEMVEHSVEAGADLPETTGTALVMVDRGDTGLAAVATAYARQVGATVVAAPRDLRRVSPDTRAAIQVAPSVTLIGSFGAGAEWQLEVVRRGIELPGGGQVLFPGRRLVALYGTPFAPGLGVLGEQSPQESIAIATELAAQYEAIDGTPTVPAFDLITTVASAGAGADGDYSEELTIASLRPWVEAAGEAGVYVILDLQPGRTDFLTQAKRYEEFLLMPHVGLALDPEWRLGPEQVHLRQVGSVTGAEVNTVSEWLAGIVREHALPQKLLVVHQFKLSMITERDTLNTPRELAVVVQMDGQGPLGSKYGTFDAITAGTDDVRWSWGWKNFYDEDSPTATPEQTLAVQPTPVFISYQ